VAALVEDLGDRGFDPTVVRPSLRLHKLSGENVWSVSFAGQYRAVFHLCEQPPTAPTTPASSTCCPISNRPTAPSSRTRSDMWG